MSNSKSGNAPFSSFSSGPRSFQSKNLNNTLKPTASSSLSRDPKPSNANNLKGGMAVLVGKKQVTKSIGAAATPVPVNTPSLRSEIKSKDPWGGSATRSTPTGAVSGAKPASWTKDATDASTLDATTSSPTPAGGIASSTQPSADRGRNWAIKDDSDDDDDGPVQSNIRASESGNQYNGNRSSNYLERDWGRENYHAEEEGDEGHSGGFHRQRPPGNSDTNWHQSRSNRDGYDDRRGSGYRESRDDHFGYRDRFDRPPSDRRFGNRDSRNNADVDNHPPILNSRARALSGELVAGEDDQDRDRGCDRDSHWRHHNNRHPDGDEDRPHYGRPQYNLDRDRDRHDRDRDSLPRNRDRDWERDRDRDRPNRDGHPQRERAYSGSFAHTSDSHKNLSNKGYPTDAGPVSTAGSSGWQRASTSVNSGSTVTTVLSKERMKVNQVSTTLLRPNREVVLATSSIAGPSMKVLTKQSINTSALTGADGPPSGTNGNSNNSNAAAEVSDTSPPDSFGKTFASLLSAKERMDAAAAAGSSQRRDSYQNEGDEQNRVDHEYDEHDHYSYEHNSYSQDRRRRQGDDQVGRGGNRGSYYNREPYDDHNDDHEYYANNNGRTARYGGGGSAERGTGYSFSRHTGPPATVLPPRRKGGVLFEPKSGQFVEDNIPSAPREDAANSAAVSETQNPRVRKYSESSAHSTTDKKDSAIVPAPSTGAVAEEGGRWARVSVIKRGLAGSDSHVGTTSTTDGKQAAVTAPEKPPVLSKAQEEELKRAKYLEERKTLRTQERLARGPRTKGKLYRFHVNGDIEEVPAGERVVDGEASATHTNKEHEEIESTDKTEIVEETTSPSQTEPTEILIAGPSDIANPVTESSQLVVPAPSIVATVADHSTVANAGGASSTAGSEKVIHPNGGGKSPTTPRSSELVATASVFTPSQPLFTSLQQQQFQQQQLPQLHAQQQQQAPLALTPASLPYPGLIDSNNLPVTPAGTNSASAPGPPIFMSSPGMTNVLFGNSPAAAGAPYGMTNTGMMSMNSGMMNNMGNMGMSNMYYSMNMMPGMIMDNGSIYSMGGGNVGGLSWSNNNSVNTNTANTNSNSNAANPFMTNNSVFSSGSTWPVNANPNVVTTEDTNNSNSNPANVDAFASSATATSSVGGTTSGTVNSTATGGAMIGTMNVLSPQMSNWGNPRTTTNNSNLYGVMVSNDMDGNNNNNSSSFYYGGNATGMMGFFPNNTSGNAATNNVMMSTDAMMFGNMAQQQQQQMYGTVSDFVYNVNYQAPMTGSASSTAKGDMFGSALSNNSAGAAGGGAQGSSALTGADEAVNNNTNTMQSQSSYYSNNAGNNNNNNYNGMMAGNFNMYDSNNGGNMSGAGGYGRNSGYRNNNNFNANANNNNLNTMNFNSNNPSGGYGMNKNMQGGGSGGSFGGNYGNNNNRNNSGARNMYNAAPGGYTNRQQGRNYNNNNNYYSNAGYNNNYQQQQQQQQQYQR